MNIVALYKTYSCNEFIEASIESIYTYVDKIVFVDSNIDWCGNYGTNEVYPVVKEWEKKHDTDRKILHIEANVPNQYIQCNIGYKWIRNVFNPAWIQTIDTDEVWDDANMQRLVYYAKNCVEFNAVHSAMNTFIKSPFYKVVPDEYCHPCVLFRPIHPEICGTRGNGTGAGFLPSDLRFNHYSYVRRSEDDVFKKIDTTLQGDRDDVQQCQLVDIEEWKKEKWSKLPDAIDFHTTKYYEKSWHKIKVIGLGEVPQSLRDKPIITQYIKDCNEK